MRELSRKSAADFLSAAALAAVFAFFLLGGRQRRELPRKGLQQRQQRLWLPRAEVTMIVIETSDLKI